jgi:hypothetical protein
MMTAFRLRLSAMALPLLLARTTDLDAGPQAALDPACLGDIKPPKLFSAEVVGPQALDPGGVAPFGWNPRYGRLSRGGVHYLSANTVRVQMVTDRCTAVRTVRFGSRILTPTHTDGFSYFTQASSVPGYPGRVSHSVSVFFPYGRDGSTEAVAVALGRPLGPRTSETITRSFPVVRVERIEEVKVTAPFGFSQAEVFNIFGKALYRQFNGSANSTVVTTSDGETVRIYGYDPSSMYVNIDSRGVSFGFRFKIDKTCQPRAQVQGRFKLNADFYGISLNWVVSPYANLQSTSGICDLIQLTPLAGLILDGLIEGGEGDVATGVQGRIEEALGSILAGGASIGSLLDGSSSRPGELLVNLKLDAPSIRIQVPYDAFDMARNPTAFPADDVFTILASDLSPPDYTGGGQPATLQSGSNGLPRTGTTDWPNSLTLLRWGSLVLNDAPVARLLARRWDDQIRATYQYTPGCSIATNSWLPSNVSIRFGVNDTASDAQRLRSYWAHGYWVRLFFFDSGATRRCKASGSGPLPPNVP